MSFNKTNLQKQSGFTLIEILIAIAILSFMALGVFQIVSQSSDTADRVTIEDEEFVQVVGALKKIDRDFSSIYSPLYYSPPMGIIQELQGKEEDDYDVTPEELPINQKYKEHDLYDGTTEDGHPIPAIFYEKNTEIIFFVSSHKRKYENEKESNFSWIRYFISTNPDKSDQKILYRQEIAENIFYDELDWGNRPAFILLDNISKIEILFWNQEKEEWSDSISEDAKYLGPSLKINLIWIDQTNNENLVSKTYRILWPEFDPIADYKKKIQAMNTNSKSNNNKSSTSSGFNDPEEDDIEEEDD